MCHLLTMFVAVGCSCKDLVSRQGVGNCQKPAAGGPHKGKDISFESLYILFAFSNFLQIEFSLERSAKCS